MKSVCVDFYAVGQGLFSSGVINLLNNKFVWVYDCGTSSKKSILQKEINYFKTTNNQCKHIDLLTLSHFDKDHISGLEEILKDFTIGILMLPYANLSQRLILALQYNIKVNSKYFDFFVNPIYFLKKKNLIKSIEKILFVSHSNNISEVEEFSRDSLLEEKKTSFKTIDEHDLSPEQLFDKKSFDSESKIEFLSPATSINVFNGWEFVPYNDIEFSPKNRTSFINEIEKIKIFIKKDYNKFINHLKKLYSCEFGKSSFQKNIISLFLFIGQTSNYIDNVCIQEKSNDYVNCFKLLNTQDKLTILYSGDGFLNSQVRLQKLINFYHKNRLINLFLFQVMHHGSKNNWHPGLAKKIAPKKSIFSSDPKNRSYKHPHADVVKDFLCFHPIQVDKSKRYSLNFIF